MGKYIVAFDHFDHTLIVLSGTSGWISIVSFASVIGVPPGIANASFTLVFSLTTGIIEKVLKIIIKKNIMKILCLLLNNIETQISQALLDSEFSLEEFKTIANEKENLKKWKKTLELWKAVMD